MTLFEVLHLEGKERVVIIGYPRSGKTTLYNHLVGEGGFEGYWLASLDTYREHGFKKALYVLLEDLKDKQRYLVEGILGYRLLRKLSQFGWNDIKPDCILVCSRPDVPLAKHVGMRKGLDTIWKSYVGLEKAVPTVVDVRKELHLGGWDFCPLYALTVPHELQYGLQKEEKTGLSCKRDRGNILGKCRRIYCTVSSIEDCIFYGEEDKQ